MKKWIMFPLLFIIAFQSEAQFMQIEGIPGESVDIRHRGWCDIETINFEVSTSNTDNIIDKQRNRANFEGITIIKSIDKASPKIVEALAKGTVLKKVTLDLVHNRRIVYAQITLTNVRILNYKLSASKDLRATEELFLNFEQIKYTYKKEEFNWNVKTGDSK